ncbi:hypothetical protein [Neptuniibacter sp. QD37_11]|uniref:hypothetical protein n=1 Tax=Neptuniibacter sp. QD37_11 TaxID=3398209 RepID=UPI0039F507F9
MYKQSKELSEETRALLASDKVRKWHKGVFDVDYVAGQKQEATAFLKKQAYHFYLALAVVLIAGFTLFPASMYAFGYWYTNDYAPQPYWAMASLFVFCSLIAVAAKMREKKKSAELPLEKWDIYTGAFLNDLHKAIDDIAAGNLEDAPDIVDALSLGLGMQRNKKASMFLRSVLAETGDSEQAYLLAKDFKDEGDMDHYWHWLQIANDMGSFKAMKEVQKIKAPQVRGGSSSASASGHFATGVAVGMLLD